MMSAMKDAETTHAAEIQAICEKLDPQRPCIIAGDFNSLSTFVAPARLRKAGLIDSFAFTHADADQHPTWNWPTHPLPLSARIDYLFHTPHFRTVRSEVIKGGGSDHFLVVSELRLVEGGARPGRPDANQ